MNESAAKSFAARGSQAIDLNEFEQRLRGDQPRPPGHDPLAELATLVNSAEDPFRDLFAEPSRAPVAAGTAVAPLAPPPQRRRPVVPPSHLGDDQWAQPTQPPDMLREYAQKMRAPAVPVQAGEIPSEDDFYGIPSINATAPRAPAAPVAPLAHAPEPAAAFAPPPQAPSLPVVPARSRVPLPDLPPQTRAAPVAAAAPSAPALRGTLPPASDPLDEFERSVADLVAARGQASLAPAASDTSDYAYDDVAEAQAYHGQEQADQYAGHQQWHEEPVAPPPLRGLTAEPARRPAAPPEWAGDADVPPPPPYADYASEDRRSRKPVFLMGGALAVLIAGIGVTLAMRDGGTRKGGVPTITASNEKLKVKADESAAARPVRNVSILQNTSSKPVGSKVVTRDEQPIDLAQVPAEPKQDLRKREEELSRKLNLGDRNLTRPIATIVPAIKEKRSASGYFPEPRRVRTVMVRPDGTLIDPTASIAKPAAPRVVSAARAAPAPEANDAQPIPSAPAPRIVERAAPKPARVEARRPAAKPAESRTRTAAVERKPRVERATPASRGGGFAVQLAAPASESAARSVAGKMKAQYGSIMGGRSPSVQKAVVGSRTVYRVRITGLSRGDAGKMCSSLQSRGGKCFVARN